jgi:hypothetical protein
MLKLQLNRNVDLGHIGTMVAVLVGAAALYYQARAVRLTERDLDVKVVQVQDVVKSLAAEREKRDAEYLETLKRSNQSLGLSTDTSVSLQLRYSDYFESLTLISDALAHYSDGKSMQARSGSERLSAALAEMVRLEHADVQARAQLYRHSDEVFKTIDEAKLPLETANSRREEAVATLRVQVDLLNSKLKQAVIGPGATYREAKAALVQARGKVEPAQ